MQHARTLILATRPNTIQSIRLIHSVAELGYTIALHRDDLTLFADIAHRFNRHFTDSASGEASRLEPIYINHSGPQTRIGSIERPLIMPHDLVTLSRDLWPAERPLYCVFSGTVTPHRLQLIRQWAQLQGRPARARITLFGLRVLANRILSRFLRLHRQVSIRLSNTRVTHSRAGRTRGSKALDISYLRELASSQFTLCPAGDFVWTYRFFEATLCGSIPIVDQACSHYEGFRFFRIDELQQPPTWSAEDAEFNFRKCVALLTVSANRLRDEIERLITR